jgi:hypothetical protein
MAMPRSIGSPLLGETCHHTSHALLDDLGDDIAADDWSYPTFTHARVQWIMRALGRLLSAARD